MKTIDLNEVEIREELDNQVTEVALIGQVSLKDSRLLSCCNLDVLDLRQATFGTEKEEWCQFLGYSHFGPIYGNSGVKTVDVLKRLLEEVVAKKVILPDDVARRHINTLKQNDSILSVEVSENCKLFTMKEGKLFNKKGTAVVFENR